MGNGGHDLCPFFDVFSSLWGVGQMNYAPPRIDRSIFCFLYNWRVKVKINRHLRDFEYDVLGARPESYFIEFRAAEGGFEGVDRIEAA